MPLFSCGAERPPLLSLHCLPLSLPLVWTGGLGWDIFDFYKLTEAAWDYIDRTCPAGADKSVACKDSWHAVFSDNVHFQCHVYRELNRAFVAGL